MQNPDDDDNARAADTNSPRPSKQPQAVPILMPSNIIGKTRRGGGDDDEPRKSVQFADEIGLNIAENHFVKNLHYSTDMSRRNPAIQDCCIIS